MKKLFALLFAVALTGCASYDYHSVNQVGYGCHTFCDDYGCREVCSTHFYNEQHELVYWDTHLGCWVGPHGWWHGKQYHLGQHPGYRSHYGHERYYGRGRHDNVHFHHRH